METKEITIEPKVDSAQEFIEIALDFSNPLDLVREVVIMHQQERIPYKNDMGYGCVKILCQFSERMSG